MGKRTPSLAKFGTRGKTYFYDLGPAWDGGVVGVFLGLDCPYPRGGGELSESDPTQKTSCVHDRQRADASVEGTVMSSS